MSLTQLPSKKRRWSRVFSRYGIIVFSYTLLAIFFTYPLVLHLRTHILHNASAFGRGDPADSLWWEWWIRKALFELHTSPFSTDYLYFPTGVNLGQGLEGLASNAIASLVSLVVGYIAAYNILILFSLAASAFSAFLLITYIHKRISTAAAFLGGVIYGMSPYLLARATGHLNLLSAEWFPLFILFFLKTREEGGKRNILCAVIFFVLNALSSWYSFFFSGLFILGYLFYSCIVDWRMAVQRKALIRIGIICVLSFLILLPFLFPLFSFWKTGESKPHGLGASAMLSSDLFSFFVPSFDHTFLRQTDLGEHIREKWYVELNTLEFSSFLGFLEMILLGVWLLKVPKTTKNLLFFFMFLAFGILSLGPFLKINHQLPRVPVLPYFFLYYLPGASFMRAPNRFVLVMHLMLAILNAETLSYLFAYIRSRWRPWSVTGFALLMGGIFIFERIVFPLPLMSTSPSEFFVRAGQDSGEYVILPIPIFNHFEYNFDQTIHEKKIIGGGVKDIQKNSALLSFLTTEPVIQRFGCNGDLTVPPAETKQELSRLNVKYVVIHKTLAMPCSFSVERFVDYFGYENAVFEDDEIWVYQVF